MGIWMKALRIIYIRFELHTVAHVSHIKQDRADVTKEVELMMKCTLQKLYTSKLL